MKLSVSSYSFYPIVDAGKMKREELPRVAKEIGFDAIEYVDLPGEHEEKMAMARVIRAAADEVGIPINAYTVGANIYQPDKEASDVEVARLCKQLEVAEVLGAKIMRHDAASILPKAGRVRSFDAMLPVIAENARRVAEAGQKKGIVTCVENHGRVVQDSERLERLFNAVEHENFGLLVDIGNFVCVDDDIPLAVSRLAPYAVHVHLKDFLNLGYEEGLVASATEGGWFASRACTYHRGCCLGEGDIPVRRCVHILKNAGYDGYYSLEFEGRGDCIEGIARGCAYMQALKKNI